MFKAFKNGLELKGLLLNAESEDLALKTLCDTFDLTDLMVFLTKDKKPIYYIPEMDFGEFQGITTYELEKVI